MLLFDDKYECKLSTRAMLSIEKALGDNPINLMYKDDGIPSLNVMLNILFYTMRKNNPQIKTVDNVIDIYDDYIAEGGSLGGLAKFIIELIQDSGMVKTDEDKPEAKETEGKN